MTTDSSVAQDAIALRVDGVSKKFCRSLKRSLWYGMRDLGSEFLGRRPDRSQLRDQEFWALRGLSFEVRQGETVGLIGHNGAGKSTILKLVNGLIKPDQGSISIWGRIGALIELGAGFNPLLTGRENIYINASVLGLRKAETDTKLEEIIEFAEIGDFLDMPLKNYSSGMKVRLGFSIASHLNPDILLIDEILSVGDASFRERSYQRLLSYKAGGGAIVFVSHNLAATEAVCDRVLWLDHGEVRMVGEPREVIYYYRKHAQEISQKVVDKFYGPQGRQAEEADLIIDRVQCCDLDGQPQESFEFDQPFEIRIDFSTRVPVENPFFSLMFYKAGQESPFFVTSMLSDGTRLGTVDGQGTLRCVLPQPYFTPGDYDIRLSAMRSISGLLGGKKFYLRARKVGSFEISYDSFLQRYPSATTEDQLFSAPAAFPYDWGLDQVPVVGNASAGAAQPENV